MDQTLSRDPGAFTPTTNDVFNLGPFYGSRRKHRGRRPEDCRSGCRTQQIVNLRKWPVPREPLIVKNETFAFLLKDVLGTVHTSELQRNDALPHEETGEDPSSE